jgi:hypothetical protein
LKLRTVTCTFVPSDMRQSAPSRASHAPQANTAAATAKLLEKKKEFEAVSALETASTLFLQRIEGLGEDCDIMADAGEGLYSLVKIHMNCI